MLFSRGGTLTDHGEVIQRFRSHGRIINRRLEMLRRFPILITGKARSVEKVPGKKRLPDSAPVTLTEQAAKSGEKTGGLKSRAPPSGMIRRIGDSGE